MAPACASTIPTALHNKHVLYVWASTRLVRNGWKNATARTSSTVCRNTITSQLGADDADREVLPYNVSMQTRETRLHGVGGEGRLAL
eukprot:6188906-Pleurochrysis_carterae.AAC.1